MAEIIENVQPIETNPYTKPLSKDMVEKLLREKSKRVTITTIEEKKKQSECWQVLASQKVMV